MGHGNVSDLVALSLIGSSVVSIFYPALLFKELGLLKASFGSSSAELEAMVSFMGGLLLVVGMMISGVKWNPVNGKMSGFGVLLCVYNMVRVALVLDNGAFVPRPVYLLAAVLLLGGLHIFLFPSNPPSLTKKTDKNNHGNFSDLAALSLIAAAVQCAWFPSVLLQDLGPIKATFATSSPELEAVIQISGGLLFAIAMIFSGVKWNPANGKMSGMGCFLFAANAAWGTFTRDARAFVPRLSYGYALVLFLAGLNIFLFPSNPLAAKPTAKKD